jgi:hypothetical protein
MNVQLEISIKVQMSQGAPVADQQVKPRYRAPGVTSLLSKLVSQPWIAMIVREFMQSK